MEKGIDFVKAMSELLKVIPNPILIILFSLSILMPYWYCSIFLIANHFYLTNPQPIILAFTFILSINWFLMNLGLTAIKVYYLSPKIQVTPVLLETESFLLITALLSMFWISISLFLAHIYHWNFILFIEVSFGYIVFDFVATVITYLLIKVN